MALTFMDIGLFHIGLEGKVPVWLLAFPSAIFVVDSLVFMVRSVPNNPSRVVPMSGQSRIHGAFSSTQQPQWSSTHEWTVLYSWCVQYPTTTVE